MSGRFDVGVGMLRTESDVRWWSRGNSRATTGS